MQRQTVDFDIECPGLEQTRVLIVGREISVNGDLETSFFEKATGFRRHLPGLKLAEALFAAASRPGTETVVVVRNPDLVLDDRLPARLAEALADAGPNKTWSIAAAGGLGLSDSRHLALYSSECPAIPLPGSIRPLVDPMPDLYLVNAALVRTHLKASNYPDDAALELTLTIEGYLEGLPALFLPRLSGGIDGALLTRDLIKLSDSIATRFVDRLGGQSIPTLSGNIDMPETPSHSTQDPRKTLLS
ncbi:MAG: hypothetical protein AAGK00_13940 [Pseudomonadota bacterium]